MEKCIYYKNENNLTFVTQEHIFPKCIGGIGKLEKGIVSDKANKFFADNLEIKTMRESAIVIGRSIHGYRKKPSKEKKKNRIVPKYITNSEIDSRTLGKIALNVLAKIKGKEFVLCDEIDNFRNWILNGKDDWFHCIMGHETIFANKIMPPHSHYCIFSIDEKYIIADVCLYNYWRKMFAICKRFDNSFINPDGYICDWKNKQEYSLMEIILKYCQLSPL